MSQGDSPSARPARMPRRELIRFAIGFYGLVLLFAVGYALFSKNHDVALLGPNRPTVLHLLAAIALGLVIVGLTRVALRMWKSVGHATDALAEILGPLTWKDALILAAVSSISEEVLFRGALFSSLGLIGSSLLFGLVHVVPRRALWMYPLFAAGAGLVLGLLRDGSGSVYPPIIAHFVVNTLNLHFIGQRATKLEQVDPADDPATGPGEAGVKRETADEGSRPPAYSDAKEGE